MKMENDDISELMKELADDPRIQKMKEYIQHGNTTTYSHVFRVARFAARLDRFFPRFFTITTSMTGIIMGTIFTAFTILILPPIMLLRIFMYREMWLMP